MVTWGDIRTNIDIQSDFAVVYYDSNEDERYEIREIEGYKLSDFDDCEVQYIYYDNDAICFELSEEEVLEVIGRY